MRWLLLFFMLLQVGCATQYILPTNRFMTPESQGGMFNSQFEIQQTTGHQLTADLSQSTVNDGVTNALISRTGYLFSTSIFDQIDLFWNHTGAANSMIGAKFQFMGSSRTGKGAGHKMALSAAIGGNEHQIEGSTQVRYELKGNEFQFLYGYRFNEIVLLYSNLSYSTYSFSGKVTSSDSTIDGLRPKYESTVYAGYAGMQLDLGPLFGKLECGYQQLKTTDTKDVTNFTYGYSVGVSW